MNYRKCWQLRPFLTDSWQFLDYVFLLPLRKSTAKLAKPIKLKFSGIVQVANTKFRYDMTPIADLTGQIQYWVILLPFSTFIINTEGNAGLVRSFFRFFFKSFLIFLFVHIEWAMIYQMTLVSSVYGFSKCVKNRFKK